MKKTFKVILSLSVMILVFVTYVQYTYHQKFEVPVTGIRASSDSSMIARGKYLVLGPSHCYHCHTNDSLHALNLREPLIGGNAFKTPFGDLFVPNITMDKETGIGNLTDEQIAQAIRYNVNHRGEAMPGYMSFNDMSDDDISAIVSYLKTTTPVTHKVPEHNLNFLGKVVMRFMIKPNTAGVPSTLKPDSSAEYGKYIAFTVGQCNSCHTKRDKVGQFVGQPLAGGATFETEDGIYTSANLTPDDSTGRITHWTEEVFIQRFRAGRAFEHSPMPWEGYQNMSEQDLKALYAYFKSLPPTKNEIRTFIAKK